jgi:hypothetical protein
VWAKRAADTQEEGWRDRGRGGGEEQEGHHHWLGRAHGESESEAGPTTLAET